MNKLLKKILLLLLILAAAAAVAVGVVYFFFSARVSPGAKGETASLRSQAVRLALEAAEDIKAQDYEALGTLVSPEKGLVFTPYSTVDLSADRWYTAGEVKKLGESTGSLRWGTDPSTGKALELTVRDFFLTVLGDYDYTCAPLIGVNYITQRGNALENVTEVFPGATFVDLHNPGTDGRWTTLRLVFEQEEDVLYLVAVIHCQYTI